VATGDSGRRGGFSILEVMAVVIIIATLAALAIPTFVSQIRRSRTSEAVLQVGRLWNAAFTYYDAQHVTDLGVLVEHVFPDSTLPTPAALPTDRVYAPDPRHWDVPTWNALNFSMPSPHRYQYLFLNLEQCEVPEGAGPGFEEGGLFARPGGPLEGFDGLNLVKCLNSNQSYVCHAGSTLRVGTPAVLAAHLEHGDKTGICEGDDYLADGFLAVAAGNLDGDDVYSYFYRGAIMLSGGRMVRMMYPTAVDPLE
jgi:prepilin-type N-terminal cleavage/methylation domain-containing protein